MMFLSMRVDDTLYRLPCFLFCFMERRWMDEVTDPASYDCFYAVAMRDGSADR